jgi:formylglycine-generating enzyme required for sulfatase activity
VRFAEALAYAARGGQRLPTLLELEYATRDGLRYRAWSWDALGDVVLDDPGPRVRGLSRAAEWTASPAAWRAGADAPPGPCIGPGASIELFLPLANAELLHAEELWIRGSLGGTAQPEGAALRRDFAAVDAVPARSWTNARVGFRCARDAREAREAQGSLTRGTREESPR